MHCQVSILKVYFKESNRLSGDPDGETKHMFQHKVIVPAGFSGYDMTNPPQRQTTETDEQRRAREEAAAAAEAERVRQAQQALLDAAASKVRIEAITPSLKLPEFWKSNPAAWFLKTEALFTLHRITADQTKFAHVIGAFDAETFIQLQDAILAAPEKGKYENIKETVISRYADSADRSLQRLLNEMALGSDRPSLLLGKMRNLAQGRLSDDVLRVRWAALLPTTIQPLLKILPSTSLNELAILADRLLEGQAQVLDVSPPQSAQVNATAPTASSSLQRQIDDLRAVITVLTTQLADRQSYLGRGRSRSRSGSRQRQAQRASSPGQPNAALCYYHNRWGSAARNCRPPCSFSGQGSLNP